MGRRRIGNDSRNFIEIPKMTKIVRLCECGMKFEAKNNMRYCPDCLKRREVKNPYGPRKGTY